MSASISLEMVLKAKAILDNNEVPDPGMTYLSRRELKIFGFDHHDDETLKRMGYNPVNDDVWYGKLK